MTRPTAATWLVRAGLLTAGVDGLFSSGRGEHAARPPTINDRWWIQFVGHIPFVAVPIVRVIGRGASMSLEAHR